MSSVPCVADMILFNGDIWCGYADARAEAVAIWEGKVLATGKSADMLQLRGAATKVIDLKGRFATRALMMITCISWHSARPCSGLMPAPPPRRH